MSTMIALVGEQPLPNFLPVLHYHPDNVLLPYTTRTEKKYEYLRATLQNEVNISGLEVDPYDIPEIARMLNEELEKQTKQPLMFNLTGGTKTMSLAAYQAAQQRLASIMYLQSEGKNTRIYGYTWESQRLQTTGH